MKRIIGTLLAVLIASVQSGFAGQIEGDVVAGKIKAVTCVACHGLDGNSVNPVWPSLASQHALYSYRQLVEFKKGATGKRPNPVMASFIANLTEQDFKDLSLYFASQPRTIGTANATNIDLGKQIYRGGDSATHVSACMACHGPNGIGNRDAGFPNISGQHAAYIDKQLKDYRSKARANDTNEIMEKIAARMSDKQIEAVANYIQGLH